MPDIESLKQMMPPPIDAGTTVDWSEVESVWGRRFPSDYQSFVATYGEGTIENYLAVLVPKMEGGAPVGPMDFISDDARGTWEELDSPHPANLDVQADDIIAWGSDSTGDLLCWAAVAQEPDAWKVIIYNRGEDRWIATGCGMVEFLHKLFLADFTEPPLSGEPLWGDRNPRFLTEVEMGRLRSSGIDPWD